MRRWRNCSAAASGSAAISSSKSRTSSRAVEDANIALLASSADRSRWLIASKPARYRETFLGNIGGDHRDGMVLWDGEDVEHVEIGPERLLDIVVFVEKLEEPTRVAVP